ncbi:MAG: methyltransferase domain-containing protein [Candidatus Parcubacteria bacterium]|nr:methyltransferase domain-containing protein [Burkholderiales bacterium]
MSYQPPYAVSFEANAFQGYLAGMKDYWRTELYREVVAEASALEEKDPQAIEQAMRSSPAYRMYAWQERVAQQFKFLGRWGMVTTLEEQKQPLEALLAKAHKSEPQRLRLKTGFVLPDYITDIDPHQLPGGTWRDPFHAWVMAWFQSGLSFAGSNPDALVEWYAGILKRRGAEAGVEARKVLDLGCFSGRSTRAIKRAMPQAEVYGCDVCEPTLRQGHLRAVAEGTQVILCQENAESLSFSDCSFDLVASHWLFHELPPDAIRNVIHEAARVLKPGGVFAVYDMCTVPGGAVGEWLHAGMARRNNEPYAQSLVKLDLEKEMQAAGFENTRIDVTSPEWREGGVPQKLPASRYMYMSMASGTRRKA